MKTGILAVLDGFGGYRRYFPYKRAAFSRENGHTELTVKSVKSANRIDFAKMAEKS